MLYFIDTNNIIYNRSVRSSAFKGDEFLCLIPQIIIIHNIINLYTWSKLVVYRKHTQLRIAVLCLSWNNTPDRWQCIASAGVEGMGQWMNNILLNDDVSTCADAKLSQCCVTITDALTNYKINCSEFGPITWQRKHQQITPSLLRWWRDFLFAGRSSTND